MLSAHFKKPTALDFSIRARTQKCNQANREGPVPPTFRRVVLPDDAGVRTTDRLAHEVDVAALVDRDILGHVGDPGGY